MQNHSPAIAPRGRSGSYPPSRHRSRTPPGPRNLKNTCHAFPRVHANAILLLKKTTQYLPTRAARSCRKYNATIAFFLDSGRSNALRPTTITRPICATHGSGKVAPRGMRVSRKGGTLLVGARERGRERLRIPLRRRHHLRKAKEYRCRLNEAVRSTEPN